MGPQLAGRMKVFDLECAARHVFEGWFAREADFTEQMARQLVQCPVCGDAQIVKRLSAPRLNVSRSAALHGESEHTASSAHTHSNELALATPHSDATQTLLRLAKAMLEKPRMWARALPKRPAKSTTASHRPGRFAARLRRNRRRNSWMRVFPFCPLWFQRASRARFNSVCRVSASGKQVHGAHTRHGQHQ